MNTDFLLTDKKIIITGASSGIGRSCAVVCASLGATLLLFARDEQRLNDTKSLLDNKDNHTYCILDLQASDLVNETITLFVKHQGKVSGFIHAAGIEKTVPLAFINSQQFKEIFDINFYVGVELAKICSKKSIVHEDGASFIFISSILSKVAKSGTLIYAASKGALNAAVRTLAVELAKKKIRINAVLPSIVITPLVEQLFESLSEEIIEKRESEHLLGFGEPKDVANSCAFLLSPASKWITGTEVIVDGGYSCI
jgi:NAD(P)-dependent dehydrogenase (short-subunit alcohol dehydrogenase family)